MPVLHNKINGEELKAAMLQKQEERLTISFYQYHQLADPQAFRDELYLNMEPLGVLGRIYVASEGINAQVSVANQQFEAFRDYLSSIHWLNQIRLNVAVEEGELSFFKLKIKVRPKILADGLKDETFDVTKSGKHITAEEFNSLTDREETVLIDMRNHYETEVGHFEGAVCPDVDTFRDSLPIIEEILEDKKGQPLVMYCTGGIRCEKASAWFKHQGFDEVYQLEGGIIKYAHDVKEKGLPNKFRGKNFVFDDRMGERISEEIIAHCHQCGAPCDTHTNCSNVMCNLLFIQCEECARKYDACCCTECQEVIHLPEEEQLALRKGQDSGVRIFSKGRFLKG
ncbi:MAG: rhodanese-related sulfurtransferase [Bacteroidota bacterium]